MLKTRSLFFRVLLAALAGVFLFLLGFVGVGWLVWKRSPRLRAVVGEDRMFQLRETYLRTAAALLPGDRDGDGVCDGLELFMETNPRNPNDHFSLDLHCERDGIDANAIGKSAHGFSAQNTFLLQPGERVAVRLRTSATLRLQNFPAGFRFQVALSSHLLAASPGGVLAQTALRLPGTKDGTLSFDLEIAPGTVPLPGARGIALGDLAIPPVIETITVTNAATGELLGACNVWCVWKRPPVNPAVDPVSLQAELGQPERTDERFVQLNWPASAEQPDALLIEAARDVAGAEWFPMHIHFPGATEVGMYQALYEWSYRGPLKYRVVPIRYFPP